MADEFPTADPVLLPGWGRVASCTGATRWCVMSADDVPIAPIQSYLEDLVARDFSDGTVRSYAYALLRWWRWLRLHQCEWNQANPTLLCNFVLWLMTAQKPQASARTLSKDTAGSINSVTGKMHLGDGYHPRTIRHSNAVIRSFYTYTIETGTGPLLNPVQLARSGTRSNAHHNVLEDFRPSGRIRYNAPLPKRRPRTMNDKQWRDVFAALGSNRDRAILAIALSNGARASEILGIKGADIDWGEQLVRVIRKGSRDEQWLPISAESMIWLRLYLNERDHVTPGDSVWQTVRKRSRGSTLTHRPLSYEALRAVFRRLNTILGTNWSMHDLRHTAALRMSRDKNLTLQDLQTILGHRNLQTTIEVYLHEADTATAVKVLEHLSTYGPPPTATTPTAPSRYAPDDLDILFGRNRS